MIHWLYPVLELGKSLSLVIIQSVFSINTLGIRFHLIFLCFSEGNNKEQKQIKYYSTTPHNLYFITKLKQKKISVFVNVLLILKNKNTSHENSSGYNISD